MSARDRAVAVIPGPLVGPVTRGVRRGRDLRHRVSVATHAGPLGQLLVRMDSAQAAAAENSRMRPPLTARLDDLEQEVAGVAERFLAARHRP